ncbi:hypothetical protein [Actinokineospora inagensis]|uniref:hypothetical protein n=1 Tax=Actinokineospora inagensis TaxID=103730 RepID=UPI0004179D4D|nr:hypothetical protein [Actinokineospora inagensis]
MKVLAAAVATVLLTAAPARADDGFTVAVSSDQADFAYPSGALRVVVDYSCAENDPITIGVEADSAGVHGEGAVFDLPCPATDQRTPITLTPFGGESFQPGNPISLGTRMYQQTGGRPVKVADNSQNLFPTCR